MIIKMKKGTAKSLISLTIISLVLSLAYLQTIVSSANQESTVSSSVTISGAVAITLSGNFTGAGVVFKTAAFGAPTQGTNGHNATGNNNNSLTDGCGAALGNLTQYWLTVDSTTNVPVMTCLKDNAALGLLDGTANISNTNYKYSLNITNTAATLPYPSTVAMTNAYVNTSSMYENSVMNSTNATLYYRFTLDIPALQKAGTYNNSLLIKATDFAAAC